MDNILYNRKKQNKVRKKLRNTLTPAEAKLWSVLKSKNLKGKKFRRQFGVGSFVLDFYCPEEKLAIELDGQGHYELDQGYNDDERTKYLNECGIEVLRFENKIVWDNLEWLISEISRHFK